MVPESPHSNSSLDEPRDTKFPLSTAWKWHHEDFKSVLGRDPSFELIMEIESAPFAHEAGVFFPRSNELFVTSNRYNIGAQEPRKEGVRISKITLHQNRDKCHKATHEWIESDLIHMANGGVNYYDGVLFCAQGSRTHASGLYHMSRTPLYTTTPLLTNYHGVPFNSVNDVIVSKKDGSIWFTDPSYGSEQGYREAPELPSQIYCFYPRDNGEYGTVRAVADGFGHPNGLCFSPDESTLYVTDTDKVHGSGSLYKSRPSSIYAFSCIQSDKQRFLCNRRLFAFVEAGIPDGIKCDTEGRVYSGCGDGIHVWSPQGVLLGRIQIPGGVANFCFGYPGEIFALNEHRLWKVSLASSVKGALLSPLQEGVRQRVGSGLARAWKVFRLMFGAQSHNE